MSLVSRSSWQARASAGIVERRGLEGVASPRAETIDVPRQPDPLDRGAHAVGQAATQALRLRVGRRCQDLGQHRAGGGHGQGIREERAADGDQVRALAVGTLDLGQDVGDRIGHAPGAEGHAAGDRLAHGQDVRRQAPGGGQPARPDDLRMRLVDGQERPLIASHRPQRVVVAGVGQDQAMVVGQGGLRQDQSDLAALERSRQRLDVVERHEHGLLDHRRGHAALLRHQPPSHITLDEGLVEVAQIVAVEEQHLVAAGGHPGDADGLRVGLAGRERVLPLRQAIPTSQLLGDDDGILGRQQELVAPSHAIAHRADERLRSVAAEHRHVGDVEVPIGVAVHVGEPGAVALGDPRRRVVIAAHVPGHGHAVGHRRPSALPERDGPGVLGAEAVVLGVLEGSDAVAIDGPGHATRAREHRGRGLGRGGSIGRSVSGPRGRHTSRRGRAPKRAAP